MINPVWQGEKRRPLSPVHLVGTRPYASTRTAIARQSDQRKSGLKPSTCGGNVIDSMNVVKMWTKVGGV